MTTSKVLSIVLLISVITLLGHVGVRIWFWKDMHLEYDAANFSNIASPIISLISLLAFAYTLKLSIDQIKMLGEQNQTIISQHIQEGLEYEFASIERELHKDLRNLDDEANYNEFNALSVLPIFSEILAKLRTTDLDYEFDRKEYRNGEQRMVDYYRSRPYYHKLIFIYKYSRKIMLINERIKDLINEINESKLTTKDKFSLKRRVYDKFVEPILTWIYITNELTQYNFPQSVRNSSMVMFIKIILVKQDGLPLKVYIWRKIMYGSKTRSEQSGIRILYQNLDIITK